MVTNQQVEDAFNRALGGLLRPMLRSFEVRSENINVFKAGASAKRPDVLLTAIGRSPVAIECEFRAGVRVEREAKERLVVSQRWNQKGTVKFGSGVVC